MAVWRVMMMNTRGILVALVVLAAATLLMVFFVLPRIADDKKPAETAITTTSDATNKTAPKPAEEAASKAGDLSAQSTAKMTRLQQSADSVINGLAALFADGPVPTAEAYAGARAAAEAAVAALASLDIPETLDTEAAKALTDARVNAQKALALLKALPAEPDAAANAIAGVGRALRGEPDVATQTPTAPAATSVLPDVTPTPAPEPALAAILPSFDVLRVEPDGSTVIAGKAAAGSKLDILDDTAVIASVEVGQSGDFAAVLDTPLPPGDHALALRSTATDGQTTLSEEVATISVPKTTSGKLLAMISKPGEASRVIIMPETVNAAGKQPRVTAGEQSAAITTPTNPGPTNPVPTNPGPSDAVPGTAPQAVIPAEIQVTAVEIEGDRIFVAGAAASGSRIRALADEQMIGEATSDPSGHFVVEGKMALSVGNHMIVAEKLDANGKATVRVSVPFIRPEGQQVAVVAQSPTIAAGTGGALVPLDQGAFEKLRNGVGQAFGILQRLYADGRSPTLEALAAARSATEIALKSLTEFHPVNEPGPAITAHLAKTLGNAATALSALQVLPRDVAAVGAALPKIAALVDAVLQPFPGEIPAGSEQQAAATPGPTATEATANAPAGTTETAQAPKTIQQAPLTHSSNTVIIRPGDTLWQISRRVYGQGVRYTTIYLANEAAIHNPDLIEPGQIFNVPSEALPDAEEFHRKRMSHPPAKGG
ncbi:MAG: LysM peptidoglycan-binding domain-containing protein [Allorhizobium sp.]